MFWILQPSHGFSSNPLKEIKMAISDVQQNVNLVKAYNDYFDSLKSVKLWIRRAKDAYAIIKANPNLLTTLSQEEQDSIESLKTTLNNLYNAIT